jgi:hypothetical protein
MYESVSVSPEDYLLTSGANGDNLLLEDATDVFDKTGCGGLCACLPQSEKRCFTTKFGCHAKKSVLLENTQFISRNIANLYTDMHAKISVLLYKI